VGFVYVLDPFTLPFGMNAGVYRFSQSTQKIVSVMTPGVTPAPAGGVFAGAGFGANLNNRGDLVVAGNVPTDKGFPLPGDENGLGVVMFKANKSGWRHVERTLRYMALSLLRASMRRCARSYARS
jgi:hypothetical protein